MLAGFYQADLDLPSNGLFRKEPGMLVITRKTGERIHVGRDVVITITHIHKRKVRIGIEAPRSLDVWRDELESHPSSHCDAEVDTAARR
jgi:carbon storage regulator